MNPKTTKGTALALGAAMALVALAGLAAGGIITDEQIENKILEHEIVRDSTLEDSRLGKALVEDTHIANAHLRGVTIVDSHIEESYIDKAFLSDVRAVDTRITQATLESPVFEDATLCFVAVPAKNYHAGDTCVLLSNIDGSPTEHAKLVSDAPDTVHPGASYDLMVEDADAQTLTVHNDPAGAQGLLFTPDVNTLNLGEQGLVAAAENSSVAGLELWVDGAMVAEFGLGETVQLPDDDFTLRVHVAEKGIIDAARLGLVLDLDGHGLRPAMTTFEVVAEDLIFAPLDKQLFAPFLADNVARLVLTLPVDQFGNVDRDVEIAMSSTVTSIDSEGAELVGDPEEHVYLHDDSRLFSENPFLYMEEVDAAHHPQTLELLVRAMLGIPVDWGMIDAYGTHMVVQSPYALNVTLHAEGTTAAGETLDAEIDIPVGALPDDARNLTVFGNEYRLPGSGTLHVDFVDANGQPVAAQDDWTLMIEETPSSHQTSMVIDVHDHQTSFEQKLAGSVAVGTPFGNFVPSQYQVCLMHDGMKDCALDGGLVAIETNQTTTVEIVVG